MPEATARAHATYTVLPQVAVATGRRQRQRDAALQQRSPSGKRRALTTRLISVAPTTQLGVTPLAGGNNYQLNWTSTDDAGGSGIDHVTIYVAADGGATRSCSRK